MYSIIWNMCILFGFGTLIAQNKYKKISAVKLSQFLKILQKGYSICPDNSSYIFYMFCSSIVNICKMCISLVFWFREYMRKTPAFEFSTFSIILQTVCIICLNNSSCSFQDTKLFQFSCTDSQHRDKHHTLIFDNYEKKSVTTIISVRIGLR